VTARPGQWDLLGHGSDPVPGTPYEVSAEGRHYSSVATEISTQISRLRQLTHPDERLKGHYTEGLVESCSDLADHLSKIEDRFATVGREVSGFEGDLETARTKTGQALADAVEAERQRAANAPVDAPAGAPEPTDAEKQAAEDRADRHSAAETALTAARTACNRAMEAFEERADAVARTIRDASDDDMKDSTWDKFKDFVSKVAGVLDAIADVLGWIATGLMILALFIPGLNLLVIAAVLLVGALLLHTLLAATGNGSWLDVAFDVVGLATLGIGSSAAAAAKVGRAATLATAGRTAGRQASAQFLSRASFNGGRGILGGAHSFLLRTFSSTVRAGMRTAADDAARVWTQRALPSTTIRNALAAGGDHSLAALAKDHRLLVQALGEGAINPAYTRNLQVALNATRTGALTGLVPVVANPKVEGVFELWELPPYGDLKDGLTTTIGGPF
jgi:hypothetical protein